MSAVWTLAPDLTSLQQESLKWEITCTDQGVHVLAPGALMLGGAVSLKASVGDAVTVTQGAEGLQLAVRANVTFQLRFTPFIRYAGDGWASWAMDLPADLANPAKQAADAAVAAGASIVLEIDLAAGAEVTLMQQSLLEALLNMPAVIRWLGEAKRLYDGFDFPLVRYLGSLDKLKPAEFDFGAPTVLGSTLSFPDAHVKLGALTARPLQISNLQIDLNELTVRGDGLQLLLDEDTAVLAEDGKPLTLVLRKGTSLKLVLNSTSPQLQFTPPEDGFAAMAIIVPGVQAWQKVLEEGQADRLVFDMSPRERDAALQIGVNGLRGVGKLRMRPLQLGGILSDCRLTGGRLDFCDGLFDAEVTASAALPYFRDSEGVLTLRTGTSSGFSARWQMIAGQSWTDPTGNFTVHEPRATVEIVYDAGWKVNGKVGGQLQFTGAERLEGVAREWMKDFGDRLRMEFAELDLRNLALIPPVGISLNLADVPSPLKLWDILSFKLESFSLLNNGFVLGGRVGWKDIGGLSFEGRLPRLRCTFDGGRVKLDAEEPLGFAGTLTTPGGVSVSLDLRRRSDAKVEEVIGAGALTIPSMPPIAITCLLGRRKGGDPVLLLFARGDYPIPIFPGVVLRDLGVGMGINKVLSALHGLPHETVVTLLAKGQVEWPDPADPAAYVTPDDGFDLSFVAQTYIAPVQQGRETFPYVGAATLYARPTTDFVILIGAHLWLMTSLDDAKLADFRAHPAARGVLALFPRHGYLELQVRTEKNPKMSEPVPLIATGMGAATGELYLRATRDDFLFRVGPLRGEMTVGSVRLAGQVTAATYVGGGRAIAVIQGALEGHVATEAGVSLSFGPLTVSCGFRFEADVAFETLLAGMHVKGLGLALYQRARAYLSVSMSVWASISFRLVIKFWRFERVISWSRTESATLQLSIDLSIQLLVSAEQPALLAQARVNVRVFGYEFSPTFTIGSSTAALSQAEDALRPLLEATRPGA